MASLCLRCGHYGFSDLVSPWVVGFFRSNIHSGQQNHNTMTAIVTAIVSEKQKGGSGQQQEEEENEDEQQEQ